MRSKKKVCFVVQRYGAEVNGGAELQCRQFAERLVDDYDVSVVTTKAIDHNTWKNEYSNDIDVLNGVTIYRFKTEQQRNQRRFNRINRRLVLGKLDANEEDKWLIEQGPYSPQMISFLRANKDNYDAFIIVTYLYYPTVESMKFLYDKAILIPEAHEEPYIHMTCMQNVFCKPRAIFFNTLDEKRLVNYIFKNKYINDSIGGIGIDIPEVCDNTTVKDRFNLDKYILYVGRVDEAKNCQQLFDYFIKYKKDTNENIKLAIVGKVAMKIPNDNDIVALGFVSDEEKNAIIAGAEILVLPSDKESLSIVVLEAMAMRTSVMVNGRCRVLKSHCINSNGALYYTNYEEFKAELNILLHDNELSDGLKDNAYEYVNENYRWQNVIGNLENLIESI